MKLTEFTEQMVTVLNGNINSMNHIQHLILIKCFNFFIFWYANKNSESIHYRRGAGAHPSSHPERIETNNHNK